MESNNVFVTCAIGGWYPKGQARFIESVRANGYRGAILAFQDYPKNCPPHSENPYAFKVAAFDMAIQAGFKNIFWVDSSIYNIANPNYVFERLEKDGYFFVNNGYNVCQETNDYCLSKFYVSRDEAEKIPQVSSGFFGLNMSTPEARQVFLRWQEAMWNGSFKGSRGHDNQSADPRFMHHRQDQSALSLSIHDFGFSIEQLGETLIYQGAERTEKNLFVVHGQA